MVREMDQVDVGRDLLRLAETYSKLVIMLEQNITSLLL